MRLLIQRVDEAKVVIDDEVVGQIGKGILVYVGICMNDENVDCERIVNKVLNLRLWSSEDKGFDRSVIEEEGGVLLVSQFTLCADLSKGLRPDFSEAMDIEKAKQIYIKLMKGFKSRYSNVESGVFQARMKVDYVNDGPVSLTMNI